MRAKSVPIYSRRKLRAAATHRAAVREHHRAALEGEVPGGVADDGSLGGGCR